MKKKKNVFSMGFLGKFALIVALFVGGGSFAWASDPIEVVVGNTINSPWTAASLRWTAPGASSATNTTAFYTSENGHIGSAPTTSGYNTWTWYSMVSNYAILMTNKKMVITAKSAVSTNTGSELVVRISSDNSSFTNLVDITTDLRSGGNANTDYADFEVVVPNAGSYYFQIVGKTVLISSIVIKDIPLNGISISPIEDAAFGVVTADAKKVYTITNNSGSKVTITPTITGSDSDMFSVSLDEGVENTEIEDGASKNFTINFDWQEDITKFGDKTATVSLTPDNGDDAFDIVVSATAQAEAIFDEDGGSSYTSGTKSLLIKYKPNSGWNTLCMPIYISSTNFSNYMNAIFGADCKAYTLDSYSNHTLGFKKVNEISSAKPYLIYVPTAAKHNNGVLFNTYIYPTAAGSTQPTGTDAVFHGTYAPIENMPTNYYGVTANGQVRPSDGSANLKGYRAYFTGISADGARPTIVFENDNDAQGLSAVMWMENTKEAYNLQGQKVEKGRKGIYIVNGRKVVIK